VPHVGAVLERQGLRHDGAHLHRVRERRHVQQRHRLRLVHDLPRGACTAGECHDSSADCSSGQLCGIGQPSTCGACAADGQCTADPVYGAGNICFQGICQAGNCHGTSADCSGSNAGLICGAASSNSCGSCATDAQCQADATYGSSTICHTAGGTGAGTCVTAMCSTSGACLANGEDFCCGGLCTPGNCCSNSDCGSGKACVNNTCTGCSAATGNKYFVDPVNGNDVTATGSGTAAVSPTPPAASRP